MVAYPKSNGDKITATEYSTVNSTNCCVQNNLESELENSMNIAKLQFCNSLVDIPHDYLLVDAFTDTTGYNNTIQTCLTTSGYESSALTGYYGNFKQCGAVVLVPTVILCCVVSDGQCPTFGNYYICARHGQNAGYTYGSCGIGCLNTATFATCDLKTCICSVNDFCFCTVLYFHLIITSGTCCSLGVMQYCFAQDAKCICYCNSGAFNCACTLTTCYCYVKACAGCFDFYCNGVCKCQAAITTFPNICMNFYLYAKNVEGDHCGCTSVVGTCIVYDDFCCRKIMTVPTVFNSLVKSIYYTDEKYGSGTRVYNVIDASTGCCIACNVLPNCFCLLSCCVCCHWYEIIQCGDAISCIKSYAIAVGV